MKKSTRRILSLALLFFISEIPSYAKDDEVVIGLAAPLTGDQAYIGVGVLQGAKMAVEEANVRGPIFGITKIRLEALDDQHNPTQAVLAANKLATDPDAMGVVGHFNSSCTKAASSIYHEARVAQITSAYPGLFHYRVHISIVFVMFVMLMNLRGVKESGKAFAVPTYFFVVMMFTTVGVGFGRYFLGSRLA